MKTFAYIGLVLRDELIAIKDSLLELRVTFILILALIVGVVVYLKPIPTTDITLATSYKGGDWYMFGEHAIEPLKEEGIKLNVLATNGSIENADDLINPKIDTNAAFIYAGSVSQEQSKQMYSLGSISYDPVWIFYRKELVGKVSTFQDLAKYRVVLAPKKSGSYVLTKKLFHANGIEIENNPNFVPGTWESASADLLENKADVYIFLTTIVDPIVQKLLVAPEVALFDVPNAQAYQKKFSYLESVMLPAGSIDIEKQIPAKDISLIATTTTLAVRRDMHPALQLGLLMAMKHTIQESPRLFFAKRNEFPAYVDPGVQISPTARSYYNYGPPKAITYLPYWLAVFVDRFTLVVLAAFAVIYPLSKLNFQLRNFRFTILKRTYYEMLFNLEKEITGKRLTSEEQEALLKKLDLIDKNVLKHRIPVGQEVEYFLFVNALQLLRQKIERNVH
jgi:hypothetical protein